jgi:hypothetical protein
MSNYVIILSSELSSVDLSNCVDTSVNTVRHSIDGTQCVLEYEGSMPSDIAALASRPAAYTEAEISAIMITDSWTAPTDDDEII